MDLAGADAVEKDPDLKSISIESMIVYPSPIYSILAPTVLSLFWQKADDNDLRPMRRGVTQLHSGTLPIPTPCHHLCCDSETQISVIYIYVCL